MKIKNHILRPLLRCLPLFVMLVGGCSREADLPSGPVGGAPVSLEFELDAPRPIEVRSLVDGDGLSPADAWEAAIDGQLLYRLTFFLINKDQNAIVACRDLKYEGWNSVGRKDVFVEGQTDSGFDLEDAKFGYPTRAKIHFDYNKKYSDMAHALLQGTYEVVVVANWSEFRSPQGVYDGISGLNGTGTDLEQLIRDVDAASDTSVGGLGFSLNAPENLKRWNELFDFRLKMAPDARLCAREPMALSLVLGEVHLKSGQNRLGGSLIRTRSRVRITLTNESEKRYLAVSDLVLGRLSQQEAYLFDDPARPDRKYSLSGISPDAWSGQAVRRFTPVYLNPVTGANDGSNSKLLFDGYIFESRAKAGEKADDLYNYKLILEPTVDTSRPLPQRPASPEREQVSSLPDGLSDAEVYLIKSFSGEFYLKSQPGDNHVGVGVPDMNDISDDYLWWVDDQASPRNVSNNLYINVNDINDKVTPTFSSKKVPFEISSIYGITYDRPGTSYHYYLWVGPPEPGMVIWLRNMSSPVVYPFEFWKVKRPRYHVCPIRYIEDEPGGAHSKPKQLEEIRRNDLLRIHVSASYNETTGEFDYMIGDWDRVDGDIEFD